MAGTVIADRLEAQSTSQLVIENGVALTPPTIVDVNNVQIGTFCRAWVNFNGTGTVAIRASFNVSSITDNGTGDYTINFTNAMPDANYSVCSTGPSIANAGGAYQVAQNTASSPTTSAYRINVQSTGGAQNDNAFVQLAIFR
jgi:hypothetical protein